MQAAQEGDDDRGKAIAHIEVNGDLARRPRDLEHAGQPGQRAGGAEAEQHQAGGVDASELCRPRRLASEADVVAGHVAVQQHIGKDHCDQRRHHAPVHAGACNQLRIVGGVPGLQVAGAGEAEAFGVLQQPQRDRGQELFSHIDQHQRDQDFVGAEAGLENCRDHRPDPAAECAGEDHEGEDQERLGGVEGKAGPGAKDGAHDVLALGADVPDAGAEAQRQADGDQHQRRAFHQELRSVVEGKLAKQRFPENGADRLNRRFAKRGKQQPAKKHRRQHRHQRRRHRPGPRRLRPFLKPDHSSGSLFHLSKNTLAEGENSAGGVRHAPPPCRGRRPSSGRSRPPSGPPLRAGR